MMGATDPGRHSEAYERIHIARLSVADAVEHAWGDEPPEVVQAHEWRTVKELRRLADLMVSEPEEWNFEGFAERMSNTVADEMMLITGLPMHRWPPLLRKFHISLRATLNTAEGKLMLLAARSNHGVRRRQR